MENEEEKFNIPWERKWVTREELLKIFPEKSMKAIMLDFLDNAQNHLPIYFEEKELVREFIETFFAFLDQKTNT
jgi:hypothetical protein